MSKRKYSLNEELKLSGIKASSSVEIPNGDWFKFASLDTREAVARTVADTFDEFETTIDKTKKAAKQGEGTILDLSEHINGISVGVDGAESELCETVRLSTYSSANTTYHEETLKDAEDYFGTKAWEADGVPEQLRLGSYIASKQDEAIVENPLTPDHIEEADNDTAATNETHVDPGLTAEQLEAAARTISDADSWVGKNWWTDGATEATSATADCQNRDLLGTLKAPGESALTDEECTPNMGKKTTTASGISTLGIPNEYKKREMVKMQAPPIQDRGSLVGAVATQNDAAKQRLRVYADFPYKANERLLTRAENTLYGLLLKHLPKWVLVAAKPRLADVLSVDNSFVSEATHFYRISSKHVDFLICDKASTSIICAVELDDDTHMAPDRIDRDIFVEKAFVASGVPLIRIGERIANVTEEHMGDIKKAIYNYYAPHCPRCGLKMVFRVRNDSTENGGVGFYGCASFPSCTATLPSAYCNSPISGETELD